MKKTLRKIEVLWGVSYKIKSEAFAKIKRCIRMANRRAVKSDDGWG